MTVRSLFVTRLYEAELGDDALLGDLAHSIRSLAADDGAGRPRASVADLDATGGRGLLIVGTLARDWGVIADPDGGKVVWFVLEG